MTSRPSTPGLRTLANEIDDIGAELVLHYGGMPKNVPPGPPMSLVTRLCKVRDSLREAPSSETVAWQPGDQRIVCAALQDADGRVVTGARHFDSVMMAQIYSASHADAWRSAEQGFIDQFGKFLTREQAHKVAARQGQILRRVGSDEQSLFSENLY